MHVQIVGLGRVGSALAYTFIALGGADKLTLVDVNENALYGEGNDLLQAVEAADNDTRVELRTIPTGRADVSAVCVGKAREKGDSKEDLFKINLPTVAKVCNDIGYSHPVIVATNPSGAICRAINIRGVSPFGIEVDRLRLRAVGGEGRVTGDHESPVYSLASSRQLGKIANKVVLERKGYTSWLPALALHTRVVTHGA